MEAIDFIKSELKSFILLFPQTKVRYEFDKDISTHYIEVVPNEVYHLDENYIKWENDFYINFIDKYNDQNICFITDCSVIGIDKVDFTLIGIKYNPKFSINHNCKIIIDDNITINVSNFTQNLMGINFNDNFLSIRNDFSTIISNSSVQLTDVSAFEESNGCVDNISLTKEKEYALAA